MRAHRMVHLISLLILIFLDLGSCQAPHGLLVKLDDSHPSKAIHDAVLQERSTPVCEARIKHIRELVASDNITNALEVALALKNRTNLPSACRVDKLITAVGTVFTTVATPHDRRNESAVRKSTIRFRDNRVLPCKTQLRLHPVEAPVAGFELDNEFILAESPILCQEVGAGLACEAAGTSLSLTFNQALVYASTLRGHNRKKSTLVNHRKVVRIADEVEPTDEGEEEVEVRNAAEHFLDELGLGFDIDETSTYAIGTRTILYIPVCASDFGPECGTGFNYGKTQSEHGGDLTSYLQRVHEVTNDFFRSNSYGRFELTATILTPIQLDFTRASCGSVSPLRYWNGCTSSSLDCKTYAIVEQLYGIDVINDYDFHILVYRFCPGFSWSGLGWIGFPGIVLNLRQSDYDSSVVHELGHNFGVDHASTMYGGARGARAYKDSARTWSEYGSDYSTMGIGNHESNGNYIPGRAEFMGSSKIVFDWLSGDEEIINVLPYSYSTGEAFCLPCGPISLQAIDAGSLQNSGAAVAIEIECQASNRYFFLEYREVTPSIPGVIASWTTVSFYSGRTGIADNTVLVDATPETASFSDAMIAPGTDFTLYCGSSDANYPINIAVASSGISGTVLVTLNSAETPTGIYAPTLLPTPSLMPKPAPEPRPNPTPEPTSKPAAEPTHEPSKPPTLYPTPIPTTVPTSESPTESPSAAPTQSPSFTPNAEHANSPLPASENEEGNVCFRGIIYGRPSDGSTFEDAIYVDPNDAEVAGIRCCNDNGRGDSICPDGPRTTYTFRRAYDECAAVGMRLCTIQELIDNYSNTHRTGCNYGTFSVWTSNMDCQSVSSTPGPTLETNEFNSVCFRGAIRGRPSDGSTFEDAIYVDPNDAETAGIRCCNDNGRGDSICPDGPRTTYTFRRAYDECAAVGMRLCTIQELFDNYSNTHRTGCNYGTFYVWISDMDCQSVSSTPGPTLEPNEFNSVCFRGTIRGRPSDGSTFEDAIYVDPNDAETAGIRCCNDNGRGDSICPDGPRTTYTFRRAYDECAAVGMRLCTIQELFDNYSNTHRTGCNYGTFSVWTSNMDCQSVSSE